MICKETIYSYQGQALSQLPDCIYISPHPLLRPYIANYTLTCPTSIFGAMPNDYTIIPTASATLCYSIGKDRIDDGLRGVNTKATIVGTHANAYEWLLLIEFYPSGLYSLIGIPQSELLDISLSFSAINDCLEQKIRSVLLRSNTIEELIDGLDQLFLPYLAQNSLHPQIAIAMDSIYKDFGTTNVRTIAKENNISERHLERLFKVHVGTGIKTFLRIVRINRAVQLMKMKDATLTSIAVNVGYYDQSHFVRDFQFFCEVSPLAYQKKMSVFYNDDFKM